MRLVIAALYLVLAAGAVTMVYPFVLMLRSSITSGADVNSYRSCLPIYTTTPRSSPSMPRTVTRGTSISSTRSTARISPRWTRSQPPEAPNSRRRTLEQVKDWAGFVRGLPISYKQAGFEGYGSAPSKLRMAYQEFCRKRFGW